MGAIPAVLLLDDGELDRIRECLNLLGADLLHLRGPEIEGWIPSPDDLIITSCRRTLQMPELEINQDAEGFSLPTWICVFSQPSAELRSRLSALGVHFLIDARIGSEPLKLFLSQILYRGRERRRAPRLPFGCSIDYEAAGRSGKGTLVDLSLEGARILTTEALPEGTPVRVRLAAKLDNGDPIALNGTVLRSSPATLRPEEPTTFSVVLHLPPMDADAHHRIAELQECMGAGNQATPIEYPDPAALPPAPSAEQVAEDDDAGERRQSPRFGYPRHVASLTSQDATSSRVVLGRDLSREGICIERIAGLELGSALSLALYRGTGEEPLVVAAKVVGDHAERGLGLRFLELSAEDEAELAQILGELSPLEALQGVSGASDRVFVSRLLDTDTGNDPGDAGGG